MPPAAIRDRLRMEKPRIVAAEHLNGDLVLIDFSDGTEAILTLDQLLAIFPDRQRGERLAVNWPWSA